MRPDYTDLRRSIMFAGCSYGNEKLRTDPIWPYGRVAVVYRESMAKPVIADYCESHHWHALPRLNWRPVMPGCCPTVPG
ncbi:hypothetical protein [Streptomyces sp. NBC_01361]|uniref:hypothetical protein n=1 Tax=Streptomyces sp. NBC_01361 TaxID=2903838 RepID=UPI002E2EABA7|nr:hypothetical protein [Streptomyces sp. NBC_01361]